MKRSLMMGLILFGALLLGTSAWAHGGPGGGFMGGGMGPGGQGCTGGMGMGGMGMGMGSGHMGAGMMGGGMGMDPLAMHPELAQLPAEKQAQLRKLHLGMAEAAITKRADMQVKQLRLRQTMQTFPIDQKAASEQRAAVAKVRQELFDLRLSMMAQVQQIVGKDLWERMHSGAPGPYGMGGHHGGMGPGPGYGPGMGAGPGMMGPPPAVR